MNRKKNSLIFMASSVTEVKATASLACLLYDFFMFECKTEHID